MKRNAPRQGHSRFAISIASALVGAFTALASGSALAEKHAAGEVFRDCPACPEMVVVPAGKFRMGSPPEEKERFSREGPQRDVAIAVPFALGKHEVTFQEWDACAAAGGCSHRPDDLGWGRGRRPVMNVSWHDAKAYAAWLSQRTGKQYRLPSEAEWEYAARAGTSTPFATGATISTDQANYNGDFAYDGGAKGINRRRTLEAGAFAANRFGLHDMHGSVMEWVEDCWNDGYEAAPAGSRAWLTGDCTRRVGRGGSWWHIPGFARSASRSRYDASLRLAGVGFRVARTLD